MKANIFYIVTTVLVLSHLSIRAQISTDSLSFQEVDSAKLELLTNSWDSLSLKFDSIQTSGVMSSFEMGKIDSLNSSLTKVVNTPQKKIVEKESKIDSIISAKKSPIKAKLDTAEEELGVSDKEVKLTDIPEDSNFGLNIENEPLTPDIDIPDLELKESNTEFFKLEDFTSEQMDEANKISEINEISKGVSELSENIEEIGAINQEIESINEGDLDRVETLTEDELENRLSESLEMQELENGGQLVEELKNEEQERLTQIEQLRDQKAIKNKLKERAMDRGVEFFSKYEDRLNAAHNGLGKFDRKLLKVKGDKNKWLCFKSNEMKGKEFFDRLTVGVYTQYIKLATNGFDISPVFGYQLSGLFTIGAGYVFRAIVTSNGHIPNIHESTYGYRSFFDVKAYKGFYIHGEYESLRTTIPNQVTTSDNDSRKWIDGYLLGLGKKYKIRSRINGYILALNNFSFKHNYSPYPNSIMVRVGVEGLLTTRNKTN